MKKKVLYLVKADESFYDLIRSVTPSDRYELMTLIDGSIEERQRLLSQAEMIIAVSYTHLTLPTKRIV